MGLNSRTKTQNGAAGEADDQAPAISADFLTGSTETGLERIRTRLLDLTNRNKLLNFRHSNASTLRVVDVAMEAVFSRLLDNEKFAFLPVPEAKAVDGEKPPARDYAEELGWDTSFDLGKTGSAKIPALPVLLYQESLDTVSRKIASAAKTAIEESGTNMLHLVFGFLEWFESDDSRQPRLAPLVVVPVTVERTGGKGKAIEAVLEHSGEDIETNLSLAEKMRRDFGLEIPLLTDDDTPESYFRKFDEILRLKRGWRIRPQITLALLSFGKLLMFRDLDPKNWPAGHSIAKHPLVRELFEGTKNPNIRLAEEFPIDAAELKADIPHLIRDADSSQHSALIHALRGQNLVIEGPPGTGKSQTITNLIAAALAKGKTVLFVSEKLAALEVVRRRLDDAGLGTFCLEVHSHKTKKGALLNDLAQRHAVKGSYRDPRDLDRHLAIAEEKKRILTRYASLINKCIDPFSATVFEILWARDRCGQEVASHRERLGQVMLPVVVHYTPTQFTQAEQFLSVYAQHLSAVLAACDSLDRHPWAWICIPLGFEDEERVVGVLGDFLEIVRRAEDVCGGLQETAGITLNRTVRGLQSAANTLAVLPEDAGALLADLLVPCQSAGNRQILSVFVQNVECFQRDLASLAPSVSNASRLLDTKTTADLSDALDTIRKWGQEASSVAEIRDLLSLCGNTARLLHEAHTSYRMLLGVAGCEAPAALSCVRFLLETITIVHSAPLELLHLRHRAFESEDTRPTLRSAQLKATAILEEEVSLGHEFDLSLAASTHTPDQLLGHATILEEASLWQRLFDGAYRRAVRAYRRIRLSPKKSSRDEMVRSLRAVAEHKQRRARFDNDELLREKLGSHFKGAESPWEEFYRVLDWYELVFVALPEHQPHAAPFRSLLFSARVEQLKAIRAQAGSVEEKWASLSQVVDRMWVLAQRVPGLSLLAASGSFDEILDSLKHLAHDLEQFLQAVERASLRDDVLLRSIPECLATARDCVAFQNAVQDDTSAHTLLRGAYRGIDTDADAVRHTVAFAEAIASGRLPQKTAQWLLCPDYLTRLSQLRVSLQHAQDSGLRMQEIGQDLAGVSRSNLWSDNPDSAWGGLLALAEHALANQQELPRWNHFLRERIQIRESGFENLTVLAEGRVLPVTDLVAAFHFVFYNTLSRSVFTVHTELSQVTGVTQEMLRTQFAEADRESIRLYSERVAALIDRRPVPYGNQSGPVRTWTDMALITNEINKQKRHIPIRQLIRRSANALVALKPCFMMGPLSVAQYLAPGQLRFDLIVMDEASQLKPEDAIGALARGGQVVIVGDPKQLPPTSFFQRVPLDSEDEGPDDTRTAVEEGESILDVASTLFQPVRRLRWHYRSRHHSLIAFSNAEFYQRNLIIFPSAYHDDPSLGVKHHFVADGVFQNSRNPREAAAVVEAVLEHMRQHPEESLGVVTLNFEQRELVEELLDRKLRDDPAAIAFQERMKGGQDTLFIKNLENVQGDERDVIFISTTYGPDTHGNQFQRFGPINGGSGHRRLNVLFTRAKKRTVVFSSLDPDRIQTTPSSPWGVRALKQYLSYARTGILQQAEEERDRPTNDFERSVGTALKEKGYEIVPQVGVAGFFIDLGVRHPTKPGAFLLGVECDGAGYHSGRSARDRDRLRQEILENLGWKIHRIWSTDWFKNRDAEIARLLRRIEDLLVNDPSYQRELMKANRTEALRQRLSALRDNEIRPAFPDTPADKCILSPILLEEFMQKRPKTRDEWLRRITQEARANVASKQVGQYLDRVLEVIREYE
jgi:very-short-patch-repair endonuclease